MAYDGNDDLIRGHINDLVARAVQRGHNLFHVLKMACIHPIEHYGLDIGRLRVGDQADFIEVADLESFTHRTTFIGGSVVARNGQTHFPSVQAAKPNHFLARPQQAAAFATPDGTGVSEVIHAFGTEVVTAEEEVRLQG